MSCTLLYHECKGSENSQLAVVPLPLDLNLKWQGMTPASVPELYSHLRLNVADQ